MSPPSVVVLGGGLSGLAAAYALARAGCASVTIVERGEELGGLAGTFEQAGRFYPLAYHHILHHDRTLLYFLERIGALPDVRWRRIRMLFQADGGLFNLANPVDFLRFPMSVADKARFVRLMLRCFRKDDWSDWNSRSAAELVDRWGGPGVRRAIFEPLTKLKFGLSADEVSGAWLGARLYYREGSAPLGYVPGHNWTKLLCDGMAALIEDRNVSVRLGQAVRCLHGADGRILEAELENGERLPADVFVSTVPTEVYRSFVKTEHTSQLEAIRYSAIISFVCATRQTIRPDFYWMNLTSLDSTACGIFLLSSLNPTIGAPGESCLNLMTHVPGRDHEFFRRSDDELIAGYLADFKKIFGFELRPFWTQLTRLPMYSPVFVRDFRNPPVRSESWNNVYFAGNYRTFPTVATTGTAIGSGIDAGEAALEDHGRRTDLPAEIAGFRLRSMPR
jgi:protoporphyrinogen oxidase